MSNADRWNDSPDDRYRDDRSPAIELGRARNMVSVPAILLIVCGFLGMLLEFGALGLIVARPNLYYDWAMSNVQNLPPSPDKQKMIDLLKKEQQNLRLDKPMNYFWAVLGIALNIAMLLGGLQLKGVSGYGLAMAGTVASLIPIHGCCCFSIPVGVWALIVLLNPTVKAAFAASGRPPRNPDEPEYT